MTWHIVTPEYPPFTGGIATWTQAIARALHASNTPVMVHTRNQPELEPEEFPVHRIYGRWWGRWAGIWCYLSIKARLKPGDVILCATWNLATHLSPTPETPLLISAHGSDLTRTPRYGDREKTLRKATALVPVSDFLGRLTDLPYTRLPFPLQDAPLARPGEKLLVVARLNPLKGVDQALHLARRLNRPITIVGDGPARPELKALAATLKVDASFTGRLKPAEIPWDDTWALGLFSRPDADGSGAEGLGLVFLEAAARGIPSFGSPTGGIPEVATMVLENPLEDPIPGLPDRATLQAQTRLRYRPEQTVKVLHNLTGIGSKTPV